MHTNFDPWTKAILRKYVQVYAGPMAGAHLVQKSITKTCKHYSALISSQLFQFLHNLLYTVTIAILWYT